MRDPETGNSRGFGFISYDSFEASDAAIEVTFLYIMLHLYWHRIWNVELDLIVSK